MGHAAKIGRPLAARSLKATVASRNVHRACRAAHASLGSRSLAAIKRAIVWSFGTRPPVSVRRPIAIEPFGWADRARSHPVGRWASWPHFVMEYNFEEYVTGKSTHKVKKNLYSVFTICVYIALSI